MALLGQFRQAENVSGTSEETEALAEVLDLLWRSLRVTSFEVLVKNVKRLKIMSTFDSVQDRDLLPVYTVSQQSSHQ